jgi:hypothetical protein
MAHISAQMNTDLSLLNDSMMEVSHESSPFLSKTHVVINDNNPNANYASGQVIFQTDTLTSNGKYADIRNSTIQIPFMFVVEGVPTVTDGTSTFPHNFTTSVVDNFLSTKNSDYNWLSSYSIDVDGGNVVSQFDTAGIYTVWKKMDTGPAPDLLCNYIRDGVEWTYTSTEGLRNHRASIVPDDSPYIRKENGKNPAMVYRNQNSFARQTTSSQALFDETYLTNANQNIIKPATDYQVYHYTANIKCSDLLFFANMPLSRSLNIRIVLNVNQCSFMFTKNGADITFSPNDTTISGSGRVLPLMVSGGDAPVAIYAGVEANNHAGSTQLTNGAYKVAGAIVQNRFSGFIRDGAKDITYFLHADGLSQLR